MGFVRERYTDQSRSGDPVRIEPNVVDNGSAKGKGKKKADEDDNAVEGVVYRVSLSRSPFVWKGLNFDVG